MSEIDELQYTSIHGGVRDRSYLSNEVSKIKTLYVKPTLKKTDITLSQIPIPQTGPVWPITTLESTLFFCMVGKGVYLRYLLSLHTFVHNH